MVIQIIQIPIQAVWSLSQALMGLKKLQKWLWNAI